MDTLSICFCFLFVVLTHLSRNRFYYTLSKCPGDHRIPYRGLKPNSKSSAGKYEKNKSNGLICFSLEELSKSYVQKMQRFSKTYCYYGQNPKHKGNISSTKFDEQLQNILLACFCFCGRILCACCCGLIPICQGSVLPLSLMGL